MSFLKKYSVILLGTSLLLANSMLIADDHGGKETQVIPLNTPEAFGVSSKIVTYKDHEATQVTVDPDHKSIEEGGCDNCTFLLVDKTPFHNGVIEIDIAGKPTEGAPAWARGFVGIVFRVQNNKQEKYEGFYLRPMNALEEEPRRNFSTQYFAYPDYPWNVLRENHLGEYERYADIKPGEWHTLRIEVEGEKATFSIDGKEILAVDKLLNGNDLSGGIGLFTESATDAYYKNLRITRK